VHALFSLLAFHYQYQCNWLPGKIRLQNAPKWPIMCRVGR